MKTDEFEADLRQALARRAADVPRTAIDGLVRGNYRLRARNRVVASAGLAVATAAPVIAVTSLIVSPQATGPAAHSLRARLLAAIDAARGDIIVTRGGPFGPHTGRGYQLTYPWYPRPGQQVRVRRLGRAVDGRLFQDDESIFAMPAGHGIRAMNPSTAKLT